MCWLLWGGTDWSKSYNEERGYMDWERKINWGATQPLPPIWTLTPPPSRPTAPVTAPQSRCPGAGFLSPLRLSNNASQGSNENMWVYALCKSQTAKQHIIIMLVNYTHKDMMNRNKTSPQTTVELFLAADFWWLSEVKTTQGLLASGLNPYINIYPNCLYEPIYRCPDH